jgi:hypothetical protein
MAVSDILELADERLLGMLKRLSGYPAQIGLNS